MTEQELTQLRAAVAKATTERKVAGAARARHHRLRVALARDRQRVLKALKPIEDEEAQVRADKDLTAEARRHRLDWLRDKKTLALNEDAAEWNRLANEYASAFPRPGRATVHNTGTHTDRYLAVLQELTLLGDSRDAVAELGARLVTDALRGAAGAEVVLNSALPLLRTVEARTREATIEARNKADALGEVLRLAAEATLTEADHAFTEARAATVALLQEAETVARAVTEEGAWAGSFAQRSVVREQDVEGRVTVRTATPLLDAQDVEDGAMEPPDLTLGGLPTEARADAPPDPATFDHEKARAAYAAWRGHPGAGE